MPRFRFIFYEWTRLALFPLSDATRIEHYPFAFADMLVSMLDAIDLILENPDAVIILQSDHGIYNYAVLRNLLEIGIPLDTVLELNYSVFSAVRIPAQYGGLDEPLNPLNISRVLVNRFVGENYALLQ